MPTSNQNCPDWIFVSPDLTESEVQVVVDRPIIARSRPRSERAVDSGWPSRATSCAVPQEMRIIGVDTRRSLPSPCGLQ